ncbi:MAG: DUF4476 domain-containing protein [Bacteroidales bacterium]|jgi:hypothetical protein|nr:DUF4476 domain-containing protein [Bacteroidales bacterium]
MKKLVLLLSLVLIAGAALPQEVESHKPMGRWCYNILTKRIEGPEKDKRRMKKGVRIISRKHISSNQAYKLTLLFNEDEYRLGFVKGLYPSITDKSNAIIMLDGFEKFSYQTILWEYIQAENRKFGVEETDITSYQEFLEMRDRKRDRQYDEDDDKDLIIEEEEVEENAISEHTEEETTSETTETELEENQIEANTNSTIFPDAAAYTGKNKGCDNYLSEKPFLAFANTVAQFDNDKEKAIICMEYTEKYCFTTSQVMKLGVIIENEASRYVFFKTAQDKVYDKDNFRYVKQLLTNERFIEELD